MTLDTGSVRVYGMASTCHDVIIARVPIACARIMHKFIARKEGGSGTKAMFTCRRKVMHSASL